MLKEIDLSRAVELIKDKALDKLFFKTKIITGTDTNVFGMQTNHYLECYVSAKERSLNVNQLVTTQLYEEINLDDSSKDESKEQEMAELIK